MTICFFGYPNEAYSRSKILIDGLKKNKVSVISCTDKTGLAPIRYWRLFKKFLKISNQCDAIFVQFPGHLNMPIAWLVGKLFSKPVIFDVFISLYDTYIFDRRSVKQGSLKAHFYWWIDKLSCTLADVVTLDTNQHIKYFVKTFRLNKIKFHRIPVGGDDTVFKPSQSKKKISNKIIVEFHGMFTRLHGAEYFVRAAKKLEKEKNLEFWLIGSSNGFDYPIKLYKKLKPKNMKYWPRLPLSKLSRAVRDSNISVGHLGSTQKANMVATNKMYHALASKVALIAGDYPATRELLRNREHCLYVKPHNDEDLAAKITLLSKKKPLRTKLANSGYQLHREKFNNRRLGKILKDIVKI